MVIRAREAAHDHKETETGEEIEIIPAGRPAPIDFGAALTNQANRTEWQAGCRWQDCPPEYGPSTTVYNRYHRSRC